jgi:putative phage-type endonuclease
MIDSQCSSILQEFKEHIEYADDKIIRFTAPQQSEDWHAFRKKGIGASDTPIIMGVSPWRTRKQLLKEKLGLIAPQKVTEAMLRGQKLEPMARTIAETMFDTIFIAETRISRDYCYMFASLDGICIDNKILIEIKCASDKNHALAKEGKCPEYYKPQMQKQMYVCEFDKVHYFSFYQKAWFPEATYEGIIVIEHRDQKYIEIMLEHEKEFYKEMQDGNVHRISD